MTNSDVNRVLNNAKTIMRSYRSKFEDALDDVEKCKDMELENASIKNDIEEIVNDVKNKLNDIINEINSVL